jgi:hypothetical protein
LTEESKTIKILNYYKKWARKKNNVVHHEVKKTKLIRTECGWMDDVFLMAITKIYKNRVFSFFSHWGGQAGRQQLYRARILIYL